MENTIQVQNTEDREDEIFLDIKNRKKYKEKTICKIDDDDCLSCGS